MNIYQRLLSYLRPHKARLFSAVICMFFYSIANSLVSMTAYIAVNGLFNRDSVIIKDLPLPFLKGFHYEFDAIWVPIIMVAVFTMRGTFDYISNYQMANIGIRVVRQLRDDLYRHLVRLSNDFYSRGRTGDFLSRILNDVGSIQGAVTDVVVDIVKQPMVILFNIPWILIWGGKDAVYAIMVFPLVAIPIVFLGKSLRRTTKKMQERAADITAFIGETLSGINIVKAFNREEKEIQKFYEINKNVFDYFKKTVRITLVQRPLVEIMGAIGAALAVWFGLQHLPADRFVAFVGSLFICYEPLKKLSKVNSTIQQSIAAGGRIFEIIDAVPTIRDRADAVAFKDKMQMIQYSHVFFEYEPNKPVLKDIDFTVKHGEIWALVGTSGAGKSTFVNLLPRFYDPTSGAIKINGIDIRQMTLKSLRDLIGIVSQDTILFNATVGENIAYGKPDATQDEIRAAAEAAYADHFIRALPKGYDTSLGERGLKLSGGQRQRIAIARALVKDPPILILDEATSHLDTESEREVQGALENLIKGRTVFVIAHRLSTVQRADRILVMEHGRIVQQGTNDSLLQQGGIYKRLYDLQFNI